MIVMSEINEAMDRLTKIIVHMNSVVNTHNTMILDLYERLAKLEPKKED